MNEKSVEDEQLYTLKEACEYLRASRSTVMRMIAREELTAYKVGSTLRFYGRDLKSVIRPTKSMVGVEDARNRVALLDTESS
jgi:excisionase family DNA binding protein